MAKIRSGILSQTRGKVAGIVGSVWKGINYVREYVIPANPKTAGQQSQRAKMREAVRFIKPAIGAILNVYVDPFTRRMSAFNRWISHNIDKMGAPILPGTITLTEGSLPQSLTVGAVSAADGVIRVVVDGVLHSTDLPTDTIGVAVRSKTTGNWSFLPQTVARGTEPSTTVTIPQGNLERGEPVDVWVFSARMDGTTVKAVSTSVNAVFTID
jgi:hypothetical protein